MTVLACAIPAFPLALLSREDPACRERPLAMVSPDAVVLNVTAAARASGVSPGQTARQAQVLCDDLEVREVDVAATRGEFEQVLALYDEFSDAIEPASVGHAYLDAPALAYDDALALCQDLGRRMRGEFGEALQPAIGCDTSKFTANAAARRTRPGSVRLVFGPERPFLNPLPVSLLPLPADSLELLSWLGIGTLGQYAALSSRAVYEQFGPAGRVAQQWAQGEDKRPVVPRHKRPQASFAVPFEPGVDRLEPVVGAAGQQLAPLLTQLQNHLQAAQGLRSVLVFDNGEERVDRWTLSEPTTDDKRLLLLLEQRWQGERWPAPVCELRVGLGDIQETPGEQLLLFPGAGTSADHLGETVRTLAHRYGEGRLLRAQVDDPLGLRVEERVLWEAFGA